MNKARRADIQSAIDKIGEARNIIDIALEQEQEAFDNMPESLQASEKGSNIEDIISALSDASETLGDMHESLGDDIRA